MTISIEEARRGLEAATRDYVHTVRRSQPVQVHDLEAWRAMWRDLGRASRAVDAAWGRLASAIEHERGRRAWWD